MIFRVFIVLLQILYMSEKKLIGENFRNYCTRAKAEQVSG